MRVVRVGLRSGSAPGHGYGILAKDGETVALIAGLPYADGGREPTGETVRLSDVTLLVPVEPSKILAVGRNFAAHAEEMGLALGGPPSVFMKPLQTLVAEGGDVVLPSSSAKVEHEGEIAVVIGRTARNVSKADAADYVFGFTCANDVSARDFQKGDPQITRGKGFDTFCPVGDRLVPVSELGDGSGLRVIQRLNGELLQDGNTSDLVFGVRRLIAHISAVFTLEPGDLILTGTPAGVGHARTPPVSMQAGDVVEVEIEGIGVLRNPVVSER
jgi:2-keto-4-pentenoate hydratase/2-oxohepta-3-ene-1,7-dioic acid hydratase in catechol pathway